LCFDEKKVNCMQSKDKLDDIYSKVDPWGYKTNVDDKKRKDFILDILNNEVFSKALDIGCGEGWITKDLPAEKIFGYDVSSVAMSRLPRNVTPLENISGKFDLIIATGVLYKQYDYRWMLGKIKECASGIVLTCNIKSWERNSLRRKIYETEFPYRRYIERLAVYDLSASRCWEFKESKLQLKGRDS